MRFDLVADAEQEGASTPVVGMGHAHRCLALAEALQQQGVCVRLFFPDPTVVERIFSASLLGAVDSGSWQNLWQEAHEPREMLVVDSYRLASLPAGVRQRYKQVACFHDDQPPPAFASIAICCDLSTKNSERSSTCDHSFYGGQYFPFHDRFAPNTEVGETGDEETGDNRLLLWFGGRESGANLAPLLTEDVLGAWRAEVVISPVVEPAAELLALAHRSKRWTRGRVRVHHDAAAMDALLPQCAVYFGGAGVAACEAALLGLRLLLCPVAPNQRGNAHAFEQAGARVLLPPLLPDAVRAALRAMWTTRTTELDLAALGLDGKGAARLARALCERAAS